MPLKLDAIFKRNSNYGPTAPAEALLSPSGKSQAGGECAPRNSDNDGLVSTAEHVCSETLSAPSGWRQVWTCVQSVCKSLDEATWLLGILNK